MSKSIWKYVFFPLILLLCLIWLSILNLPDNNLHLIACDVGQGDATLVSYGNTQLLIDGGPDNKVISCLSKHMPFWDRKLEGVILTHPDLDHYGGLTEVVKRYKVDNFLHNGIPSSSESYQVLEKGVGGRGIATRVVGKGTKVRIGKIHLDMVSPEDADKTKDSNDNSLVMVLKYDDFKAILTGDASKEVLKKVLSEGRVNYIKISHHGSKTGTDKELLDKVVPEMAVISVGKDNRYGHPNEEVVNILDEKKIKTLRTDEVGDVVVKINGNSSWLEN